MASVTYLSLYACRKNDSTRVNKGRKCWTLLAIKRKGESWRSNESRHTWYSVGEVPSHAFNNRNLGVTSHLICTCGMYWACMCTCVLLTLTIHRITRRDLRRWRRWYETTIRRGPLRAWRMSQIGVRVTMVVESKQSYGTGARTHHDSTPTAGCWRCSYAHRRLKSPKLSVFCNPVRST